MGTNTDVAELLREIADLLDLEGARFKPEAYRRAARSIESLTDDLRKVAGRGELEAIPGVGAAIGEKIREVLRDGRLLYLEKLRQQFPSGIVELMRLPGVGPKTARRFLVELQVQGPADLQAAIDAGRLNGVAGFGDRKIELLRQALAARTGPTRRRTLHEAWTVAESLVAQLRRGAPVERVEVAGSLRRRRESVGDLDLLVTSDAPERVFDVFSALPGITEVKLRGPTKETVLFGPDLQVDLRVVEPAAFGAALQYFTGSKDHNVRLRGLARDRGLRLNEYGLTRGDERIAGATEEEVYRALGLPYFPPEIRENRGEFEAVAKGVPTLVDVADLRGDLHVHLPDGSVPNAFEALLAHAAARHWEYLGVVVPAGGPGSELGELITRHNGRPGGLTHVFAVAEVAVGEPAPSAPEFDFLLARATGHDVPAATPAAPALLLTHLPLAPPGSEATGERVAAWIEYARACGSGLEVTPDGPQDGLDSDGVRRAIAAGVPVAVRGAGAVDPDPTVLATGLARRGWATPAGILNCGTRADVTRRVPPTGPTGTSRRSRPSGSRRATRPPT